MPYYPPAAGASGAPIDATYITQTANGTLTAEQNLAALATGLLKSTTATGALSIGVAGTDYPGLAFANVFTTGQLISGSDSEMFVVRSSNVQSTNFVLDNTTGTRADFFINGSNNPGFFGVYDFTGDTTPFVIQTSNGFFWLRRDAQFVFSSDPTYADGGTPDTGLKRSAAGEVTVSDGSTGQGALVAKHVYGNQDSTTAAIPAGKFKQSDLSEEFIRFDTTVGTGNPTEAVGAKTLTTTHFIRVYIEGVGARYIPAGTIA